MSRWITAVPLAALLTLVAPWSAQAQDDEEEAGEPAGARTEESEEASEAPAEEAPADPAPVDETAGFSPGDAGSMSWEQAWDSGFALYREGRHAQAIPYLERALSIEGDDPTVRAYLAECYRRTGDEARAAELLPQRPVAADDDDDDDDDDGDDDGDDDDDDDAAEEEDHDHFRQQVLRSTRRGKHIGFGVTLLNNATSLGLYVEILPVHFLSVQGGIGAGDLHTRFWWAQVAAIPIDGPLSPTVGLGVAGNFGLDYHYGDSLYPGFGDYYLARINPFAHAGVVLVTRFGFTGAFEFSAIVTGDPTFPVAPRAGFRLGLLF